MSKDKQITAEEVAKMLKPKEFDKCYICKQLKWMHKSKFNGKTIIQDYCDDCLKKYGGKR